MPYRGPYSNRVPRKRRTYMGPARSSTGWSSGSLIAIILAVLIVALAVPDVLESGRPARPQHVLTSSWPGLSRPSTPWSRQRRGCAGQARA